MKAMKRLVFLCGLTFMILAAQSASASLPYSTYGSANQWAGYKDYKQDNFDVRVMFNVYTVSSNEFSWQGQTSIPDGDQYIYTYEIINMGSSTNKNIGAFNLFYADGSTIAQHLMHSTGSQDDGNGGISPDSTATSSQGQWEWSGTNGYIEASQHSWYLIFSSDHAPVKGTFKVTEGLQNTDPGVPTPEPASIILLGSAAGWIITRKNKKQRVS